MFASSNYDDTISQPLLDNDVTKTPDPRSNIEHDDIFETVEDVIDVIVDDVVVKYDKANARKSRDKKQVKLQKTVGLWSGVGIIMGIVVGSGIFVSPEGVIRYSGSVGEALIIWFGCGIFSTMGALSFAELGVTIPSSGGDYIYILKIFGPFWAFMRIWIEVIVIRPVAHAIISLTLAEYALQPVFQDRDDIPHAAVQLVGIVAIGFLTWLNCKSAKWAVRLQNIFTSGKVVALLLVIVLGIVELSKGNYENFRSDNLFKGSILDAGKISLAMYSGLWAFSGWNELNYVSDEIQNPTKNLPLAIIISIISTTLLYLAVNISYFTLLSPDEMLSSPATASVFGDIVLGRYSWIISVSVALCCFGGINGSLFTSSRLFYVGSKNHHLPRSLAMINVKRLTPTPSVSFIGFISALYLCTDDVFALINYSNFVYFFVIGFAIVGLIVMRFKNPNSKVAFRTPILLPITASIICFGTGVLSFFQAPLESGIGVGIFMSSVPAYLIFVATEKPKWAQDLYDKSTYWVQIITESVAEEDDVKEE